MIAQIQQLQHYSFAFHEKVLGQHNQFYLKNSQHDFANSSGMSAEHFRPLNEASVLLARFYKWIIQDLQAGGEAKANTLYDTLMEWQGYYNEGGAFDSYRYAEEILLGLEKLDFPVYEELSKETELLKAFIGIPYTTKSFFNLYFAVDANDALLFVNSIVEKSKSAPEIHYYLKEMTLNESILKVKSGDGENRVVLFRMTLLPEVVNTSKNPIIYKFIDFVMNANIGLVDVPASYKQYLFQHSRGIYLSQGSKNYKKFLDLLHILGEVYDETDNYAFMKV